MLYVNRTCYILVGDSGMEDEIAVTVSSPEQRSEIGGANKFFVYTVKSQDSKGETEILRRYSDFNLLREILCKRWPGCYVPSLPEKKTIGSNEHVFVESRRRGLEIFLLAISYLQPMWYSEEMQIFLKNTSGDSEKMLAPLMKESPGRLFLRYKTAFPEFEKDQTSDAALKITEFSSYIKDSKIFLQKLTEQTEKMNQVFRHSVEQKLAMVEFLLPDYQKNCLFQNDEKRKAEALLFTVEDFEIKEATLDFRKAAEYPSVQHVAEQVKRERRELEGFEETIRMRHEYETMKVKANGKVKECEMKESKINAGKETIISKLKKQSKEEQLADNQREMDGAKQEYITFTRLCTYINNLLATREIDRFKQMRQKAYYSMLKAFALCEKEIALAEHELWARASEHDSVWEEGFEESLGMRPKEFKQMKERAGEVEDEARQIGEEGKPAKKSKKSKKKKEKVGESCKEQLSQETRQQK